MKICEQIFLKNIYGDIILFRFTNENSQLIRAALFFLTVTVSSQNYTFFVWPHAVVLPGI